MIMRCIPIKPMLRRSIIKAKRSCKRLIEPTIASFSVEKPWLVFDRTRESFVWISMLLTNFTCIPVGSYSVLKQSLHLTKQSFTFYLRTIIYFYGFLKTLKELHSCDKKYAAKFGIWGAKEIQIIWNGTIALSLNKWKIFQVT